MAGTSFAASAGFSGPLTTDTTFGRSTQVSGVVVLADGSNSATVSLRNGTTDSGTIIVTITVAAGSYVSGVTLPLPVDCPDGLYVDVGANTTVFVFGARGISPTP